MRKILSILILFIGFAVQQVSAQSDFGANKLLVTGHAQINAVMDSGQSQIGDANFSAVFLWQLSDKVFCESEIEINTSSAGADFGLEHANLVWMMGKYVNFHAGRFVPHFGLYRGRLGEGFLNRFPTHPIGSGDGGIGPMVETGAGFQGGIPLGSAKMNYDVWVSNGPQLLMDDSTNVGQFEFESFTDNNKNKAIGGRIGLLPFSNSSLEIGFSYENAAQTGLQYTAEQKVAVNMMAIDANYFQSIAALKSTLRIAGEYKSQSVTQHSYQLESGTYDFKNESNAFYAMVSLRPTASNNNTLRNLEFAARYSSFNQPKDAPWGGGKDHVTTRTTFAIDYWLKWNCVFKVAYQLQDRMTNQLLLQLYYGF